MVAEPGIKKQTNAKYNRNYLTRTTSQLWLKLRNGYNCSNTPVKLLAITLPPCIKITINVH